MDNNKSIEDFVNDLDQVILKHQDKWENHNLAGMLLSRFTLLVQQDPNLGKKLLKYVWEQLDELEQSNPGQYL